MPHYLISSITSELQQKLKTEIMPQGSMVGYLSTHHFNTKMLIVLLTLQMESYMILLQMVTRQINLVGLLQNI